MQIISHPVRFQMGTRVLFLKGRHKDGLADERVVGRATHSLENFDRALSELAHLARDGERIYGAAGQRDLARAIRAFKERQLAADYEPDTEGFYRNLDSRWHSALMAPTSQLEKLWLFDCDTAEEASAVSTELAAIYDNPEPPYRYCSKSGVHFITAPFNRNLLSPLAVGVLHVNPLMLWGY